MDRVLIVVISLLLVMASAASAGEIIVVDFAAFDAPAPPIHPATYTESGLTISVIEPGEHLHLGAFSGRGDGELLSHTVGSEPFSFVFSTDGLFDLLSVEAPAILGLPPGAQPSIFNLTSSSGAVQPLVGASGVNHLPQEGWTGISSFRLDVVTPTGSIILDNIIFQGPVSASAPGPDPDPGPDPGPDPDPGPVPEPHTLVLLALAVAAVGATRR